MQIKDQVAFVTGGASGLGLATVQAIVERGGKAVAFDLKGSDEIAALGDDVIFVEGDVTNEAQVQAAIERTSELGDLRIVVNCAGIGGSHRVSGRNGVFPLDHFTKVVTVNLIGTFNVTRLAAAHMQAIDPVGEERGVVINTASAAAFDGQVGQAAYSASKGGIVGMTLPIARDLASSQIRVMTVAPGIFHTPLMLGASEETLKSLGDQVPHPSRLGVPEEFGLMAAQIVENSMLNGETIRLDGAIRMAPR
ncbi:SDR family NAD(P)-dependent oxidoreductase [Brevibacterium jeotgali]|uniref:NAD(P)-dependent dehydrogenase, short-chain alcohol dehydrogenase family n=1 Tax=Brevibacterium jeotgali TaxID=1262550 RepID=A0A2H1L3Y7_9MICO|nr:SDR family NAD(P)-dependent oxidoreductase [Brevibacterium jeotgali]TWB98782.1 NAD(P)-dependent dehydrogenase (short-subunit alcohol dehydrogenase family) [Brevibacterium jeotgali]SMY11618.1 NAD(P)-dependent dehydrogenase, short-chain alcohol dehydrogenase family [Brevibacterium jeotgali]